MHIHVDISQKTLYHKKRIKKARIGIRAYKIKKSGIEVGSLIAYTIKRLAKKIMQALA